MSTVDDRFTQRRPAARWILTAANVAAITVPAATIMAISAGHTVLAQVGVFACIGLYAAGYHAATVRGGRRTRALLAEARRDPLTGLATRAVAEEVLERATRDGTDLTVVLADIDGLHAVNARLGHAAGDQYITAVARRLAQAVPAGGCLARQGGDEFTLLASNIDPEDLAVAIGAAMAGPAVIAGHRIQPRASVGIATSRGGDARYARACADAAMYTAKAAGGNHTMVYQPDRDGHPEPDGTRPLTRRRDLDPLRHDGVAWQPTPGDELLPLLWSIDEAHTVHQALCTARDRWAQAAAEAQAGAGQPDTARPSGPDRINVEPTPPGYRGVARVAAAEQARYAHLADRLAATIDAVRGHDGGATTEQPGSAAGVVLVGISAAFTPIEIEGLVRTAADAVYGDPDDLSDRQHELAARAHALLREEMQG